MKRVIITIAKTGGIVVNAEGFVGDSCEKAVTFLQDLLGNPINKDYKPEYYEDNQEEIRICDDLPNGYCG